MSEEQSRAAVWETFDPTNFEAGAVTAALRRGSGHAPGSIPEMWDFYRTWDCTPSGRPKPRFVAEHEALVLFGIHQQSKSTKMHRRGIGVGAAAARLRSQETVGKPGLGALMNRIGGSTSQEEIVGHLRRLVTMLKDHSIGLDYNRLAKEIWHWSFEPRRDRICQTWGREYHRPVEPKPASAPES